MMPIPPVSFTFGFVFRIICATSLSTFAATVGLCGLPMLFSALSTTLRTSFPPPKPSLALALSLTFSMLPYYLAMSPVNVAACLGDAITFDGVPAAHVADIRPPSGAVASSPFLPTPYWAPPILTFSGTPSAPVAYAPKPINFPSLLTCQRPTISTVLPLSLAGSPTTANV